jgi:hypothetical protein
VNVGKVSVEVNVVCVPAPLGDVFRRHSAYVLARRGNENWKIQTLPCNFSVRKEL